MQPFWHFLPVQVFSGEMTPAILQSCSTTMGLGLLRATERVSREVTTALGKQAARAIVGRAGLRRIAMCTWRWLGPAAKLIAAIGPAMIGTSQPKRLLVLCTTTGYQTCAFIEAAQKLGLSITFGTDRCHVLDDPWQDGALPLRFEDPEASAQRICDFAASHPLDAIVSIGDRPTSTGARACHRLGLRGHPPEATDICRDKYRSRERLRDAGLNVPAFKRSPLHSNPLQLIACGEITFPCVLKPLALSGSRGVIRADTPEEFVQAFERIRK